MVQRPRTGSNQQPFLSATRNWGTLWLIFFPFSLPALGFFDMQMMPDKVLWQAVLKGWWWWWCHCVADDKTLDWLHLYLFGRVCFPSPCPASRGSIWWRFLKTVDSRLPFGHDGTWADCALVINLVYWKASVREMMCVNCMSAPTLTPWEFLGLCIVRICVWIWFCQELSWQRLCKSRKNCINSYVLFPSPFPLSLSIDNNEVSSWGF